MKRSTQEIQVAVVAMTLTVAAVGTFFYVAVAGTEFLRTGDPDAIPEDPT